MIRCQWQGRRHTTREDLVTISVAEPHGSHVLLVIVGGHPPGITRIIFRDDPADTNGQELQPFPRKEFPQILPEQLADGIIRVWVRVVIQLDQRRSRKMRSKASAVQRLRRRPHRPPVIHMIRAGVHDTLHACPSRLGKDIVVHNHVVRVYGFVLLPWLGQGRQVHQHVRSVKESMNASSDSEIGHAGFRKVLALLVGISYNRDHLPTSCIEVASKNGTQLPSSARDRNSQSHGFGWKTG
mmetsp:Transcript_21240/g.56754  ORF Transcript_21240/g.56754 Transcript_21240/m.56754 type:complete len:240 (+) Transcript_21240:600-1319(+)